MTRNHVSRRSFLKQTALAGGALAAGPAVLPSRLLGAESPSNLVNVGIIGVGSRGSNAILPAFLGNRACRVIAVCDPFESRRNAAAARANAHYRGEHCTAYRDLREMLARDDVDAVAVVTADHWHVPAALLAVQAGKDVYVEKPLGYTIAQDQAMREACKRYGAVFQYGTQQRSMGHVRRGCELVRNGRIGKLRSVEVYCHGGATGGSTTPIAVPAGLDYDLYIGPAPMRPYTSDRCTNRGSWYISDYALGFIAGWGAHPLDVMIWGLGDTPDAVPVSYEGTAVFPETGLFDAATSWDIRGEFANGVTFHFHDHQGDATIFTGEDGVVSISRGGMSTQPASLAREPISPDETRLIDSRNHGGNFIDAVKTRAGTVSPVDVAVLSDTISHLSLIAAKCGRKISWDPHQERILNDSAAQRMLSSAMRAPWTV